MAQGLPPLYAAAVVGLVKRRAVPLSRLLAAVTVGHLVIVAVVWVNWYGWLLLHPL